MTYSRLNYSKRCQLAAFYKAGYLQKDIAAEIGVSESTISRELKRNLRSNGKYCPDTAQKNSELRREQLKKPFKITEQIKRFIEDKVKQEWSPEQISGYAKKKSLFHVSHELIYQFLLRDKQTGGELYLHLSHKHKRYRKRYGGLKRSGPIKNRRFIDERPSIIDEKGRVGDWEVDTIIGKNYKQAIVSIVERKTKYTLLKKIEKKNSDSVLVALTKMLASIKKNVLSITADNGSEFAKHEEISKEIEVDFYFDDPYSSWERGLNENTNGLIRQYIKKDSSLTRINEQYLTDIQDKLNNRPRKSLNYKTPNELWEIIS